MIELNRVKIPAAFKQLADYFNTNGFKLYLVGGAVRDLLLNVEPADFDLVTDALPDDLHKILPDGDFTYEKHMFVKYKFLDKLFDISTMKKESSQFLDMRFPVSTSVVKTLEEDYLRRDFTINALYLDSAGNLYDYCNGLDDLEMGVVRTLRDPVKRILEDPSRILRALKLVVKYNFVLDPKLDEAIKLKSFLLWDDNPYRTNNEIEKIFDLDKNRALELFNKYSISTKYI